MHGKDDLVEYVIDAMRGNVSNEEIDVMFKQSQEELMERAYRLSAIDWIIA